MALAILFRSRGEQSAVPNTLADKHFHMEVPPTASVPTEIREMLRLLMDLNDTLETLKDLAGQRQNAGLSTLSSLARRTYDNIAGLLPRLTILAEQRRQLEMQLSALKMQSIRPGEEIPNS